MRVARQQEDVGSPSGRALRDRACVELEFPAATRVLAVDGVRGWLYPVRTELGDAFELFAWFDGASYQVRVVAPPLEERRDAHACHLFGDGRICLGRSFGGGAGSLREAYGRSVLWANGYSAYLRGSGFPF